MQYMNNTPEEICIVFDRISLIPDERRSMQSKVKKKTCNPVFDETFVFQVNNRQVTFFWNNIDIYNTYYQSSIDPIELL